MSPDSPESRIGRLEQTVAALKQQVDDIAEDVRVFYPLVAGQEVMREKLERMSQDLSAQTDALGELKQVIRHDADRREEGAGNRRWQAYAIAAGLLFVMISVIAQIFITLASQGGAP